MRVRCFLAAILLLSFLATSSSARTWQDGLALTYSEGGLSMPYRLYLPADYDDSRQYPLVLFMHGAGERGTNNQSQVSSHVGGLIDRTETDYPAILVAPQLPAGGTSWRAERDYDLTLGILDDLQQNYAVDENRLYATGLSLGGFGSTRYAFNFPELFAAIAPMSGAINIPPSAGQPISEVPTWLFHGNSDGVVSVSSSRNYYRDTTGETSINFNETVYGYPTAITEPIRYTEMPGFGHNIWSHVYANNDTALYDWMFAQTRASLPSDLTNNGFVDFEDLTILLANWNKEVGADAGNLVNADTTPVNFEDLTVLLADWTGPGPAGSPEAALAEAVPEPSTLGLGLVAAVGVGLFRRKRRAK